MTDFAQPFNRLADAINQNGNSPDHQEAALRAQLFGVAFGSMFDCYNRAWNGDRSGNQQQQQRGRRGDAGAGGAGGGGGGSDPFSATVFSFLRTMTDREVNRMQTQIDDALRQNICG